MWMRRQREFLVSFREWIRRVENCTRSVTLQFLSRPVRQNLDSALPKTIHPHENVGAI